MLIDKTLLEYIDLTSQKRPAPGGGSVLALVSSLGLALSQMAMNFSLDKEDFLGLDPASQEEIRQDLEELGRLRQGLEELIDLDSQAFNGVLRAYKLDREDPARPGAIEEGYKEALAVPLKCLNYSLRSLELELSLAGHANKGLISDTAIGAILSYTALEASIYNIKINLKGIGSESYKKQLEAEVTRALERARDYKERILDLAEEKI